jgi:hypothetical protein
MTNADKIRSMTDEDLAEAIYPSDLAERVPFCMNMPECNDMLDGGKLIPDELCKNSEEILGRVQWDVYEEALNYGPETKRMRRGHIDRLVGRMVGEYEG